MDDCRPATGSNCVPWAPFFTDTATTDNSSLPLHASLPLFAGLGPDVAAISARGIVAAEVAIEDGVFIQARRVVGCHRQVVNRIDRNRCGRRGNVTVGIGQLEPALRNILG